MSDKFFCIKKGACKITCSGQIEFNKPFILDVDWSIMGVGAILSQKSRRQKQVIAYARKGLFRV